MAGTSLASQDELTSVVFDAVKTLSQSRKADLLLDTAIGMIDAGRYGPEVENYISVYLRTPNLAKTDAVKALLARGKARKASGESLLAKAQQDFYAAFRLDPSNRELQQHLRPDTGRIGIHFGNSPPHSRTPPEIWERIAYHIPRYHLRTWLFVSPFHRSIASRVLFHTMDLYFSGDDQESAYRSLDVFDRVKADKVFAGHVRSLRVHWAYEEGEMLDLLMRLCLAALPDFTHLRELEWIGYPEMRADVVRSVLKSHSGLHSLGLIGWHFDAVGASGFHNLRKFTLRAEDDDGFASMGEVRTVLDLNEATLQHLVLGAYLARPHSWDSAFQSNTIQNLTHLDLVDTRISQLVFSRIAHARKLQSLTLHGTFEEPSAATVLFGSDHVVSLRSVTNVQAHTLLPDLMAFRFILVGHDEDIGLYQAVVQFLRGRVGLRRLDLGTCPWDLVSGLLPGLTGLRVLGVKIGSLTPVSIAALAKSLPADVTAVHLSTAVAHQDLHLYAPAFKKFHSMSFLHLQLLTRRRPQPNLMSDKEYQLQTDVWHNQARSVASSLPSLDFIGWNGEHFVVLRQSSEVPEKGQVELKELPSRRRLDCGKGVDLGTDDAAWLERKDVPIDYEMPGLGSQ